MRKEITVLIGEFDVQLAGGKPLETQPKPATKSVRELTSRQTPWTKAPTA